MNRRTWAEPSAHKAFVFGAGLASIVGLSACVLLSAALVHRFFIHLQVEIAVSLFIAALLVCTPVLALFNEYTRLIRPELQVWRRLSGLRWAEVQALTAHCPPGIKLAAFGVGTLALFQCLRLGHFAVTQPGIASADVIGILAGASFFFSLCIPFLLAAAFMPSSYAEDLRRQRRGPASRDR